MVPTFLTNLLTVPAGFASASTSGVACKQIVHENPNRSTWDIFHSSSAVSKWFKQQFGEIFFFRINIETIVHFKMTFPCIRCLQCTIKRSLRERP